MFTLNSFNEHINEENEYKDYLFNSSIMNEKATPKDIDRINGIISRAKGSEAKEISLAKAMINVIKKKDKIKQRFEAALKVLGKDHQITLLFAEAAIALGNTIDLDVVTAKKKSWGVLGSENKKFRASKYEKNEHRGRRAFSSILPIGTLNLASGKCKYFNIYDTWGEDDECTIEVWQSPEEPEGKYRFVVTNSSRPMYTIGIKHGFVHDRTQRHIFSGILIDWANIGDTELIIKKYGKSARGYVYK